MAPQATWLQAPDVAGDYLKGVSIGASIAEARQRIAAEQTRTLMEAQARSTTNERESQLEQARLQTLTAYRTEQLGLHKQQLEQAAQINAARTKEAALKMADQHGFAADLANGVPMEQALYRHPRLSTPSAAVAAHKAGLDATEAKLDLSRQRLELRQQEFERKKNAVKPEKIGTMDIPLPTPTGQDFAPTVKGVPLNSPLINSIMGTNAPPGTGTNYPTASSAPAGGVKATPFKEGATIRSKKTGKLYTVTNGMPVEHEAAAPADEGQEESE